MSDKSHKVLLLLKLVLRAGTPQEKATARAQAAMMCAKHALDYDALLAQAAQDLDTDNPEAAVTAQDNGPTWDDTPADVWRTTTKYNPDSRESRTLLATALRHILKGMQFTQVSGECEQEEEMWEKVVGSSQGREVKVHVGTSIRCGMTGPKGGDPVRIWASVGDVMTIDYKTRGGRKGHTVRRCGVFGCWRDGADHAHKNNPGILGRFYRELINVRDAANDSADAQPAPTAQMRENDEEFLLRTMRLFRASLERMPHPSRQAPKGATLYDYVAWCMENRYDRSGRDRWAYARNVVESRMG